MRLRRFGSSAVLIDTADAVPADVAGHLRAALGPQAPAVHDIVPGAETVLVRGHDADQLERWLAAALSEPATRTDAGAARTVTVAVRFDGPDLGDVAEHRGIGQRDVVEHVLATELVSAFCGFSPGFAYLAGLGWDVPRRSTPRTHVPAGSLGLAGAYAGIYPTDSPGGWRLIGTAVDVTLFDHGRERPALLEPGVRIRLVEAL